MIIKKSQPNMTISQKLNASPIATMTAAKAINESAERIALMIDMAAYFFEAAGAKVLTATTALSLNQPDRGCPAFCQCNLYSGS